MRGKDENWIDGGIFLAFQVGLSDIFSEADWFSCHSDVVGLGDRKRGRHLSSDFLQNTMSLNGNTL